MSKKKIYIIIIVVCFAGMAGVLYYGFGNTGGSTPPPPVPTAPADGSGTTPVTATPTSGTGAVSFGAPAVFPADTKFDWSLLDSDTFKNLQGIPALTLDPSQVGRDNPFSPTK